MSPLKPTVVIPLLIVVSAAIGCSNETGPRLVPVSGVVTIDGEPAANVYVYFKPIPESGVINPGAASEGFADENGRFSMKVSVGNQPTGAVVGKHRVSILGSESRRAVWQWEVPGERAPDEKMPEGLRTPPTIKIPKSATALEFEVPPGGTDTANFELTRA